MDNGAGNDAAVMYVTFRALEKRLRGTERSDDSEAAGRMKRLLGRLMDLELVHKASLRPEDRELREWIEQALQQLRSDPDNLAALRIVQASASLLYARSRLRVLDAAAGPES